MDPLTAPLLEHARGAAPATTAVLSLCRTAPSYDAAEAALSRAEAEVGPMPDARALLTPAAFALVGRVLEAADHATAATTADWARAFDRLADVSADAGSALYAFGDADLLGRATAEVVAWLCARGLVDRTSRVLELGCGSGRFQAALAGKAAFVAGLDVSGAMAAIAVRRGGAVFRSDGRDLAAVADGRLDLLLAVDSWPYLVNAGVEAAHLADARRTLRPGGRLVVLNWSYGDESAAPGLAETHGLAVEVAGERPFALWDARAYVFRRI